MEKKAQTSEELFERYSGKKIIFEDQGLVEVTVIGYSKNPTPLLLCNYEYGWEPHFLEEKDNIVLRKLDTLKRYWYITEKDIVKVSK